MNNIHDSTYKIVLSSLYTTVNNRNESGSAFSDRENLQ
jgi:hypothetical protein